jgi:hypothetical protein
LFAFSFRQDGTDLNTIANYAAQAIKMLSLIFTVVSGGSSDSSSDRIDTGSLAAGAAAGGQAVSSFRVYRINNNVII